MLMTPSLQQRLREPYQRKNWQDSLRFIFPTGPVTLFASPQPLAASQEFVRAIHQIGTLKLPDNSSIALLEVETTNQVQLARNRVALRNFVSSFIDEANASAVLAVFHQEKSNDWRLTYAARQTIFDEDTSQITTIETAPRRFTFLLGEGEPCRTAAERFAHLREKGSNLGLADVEKAFSVEALSKEFFRKYNEHYDRFLAELTDPERIDDTRARFAIDIEQTTEAQIKADKPIRDFAKKLLGRLIFLHFLQKKGWMHAAVDSDDWSSGDKDFLSTYYQLAESNGHADGFHSVYLAPLFFQALNTEREGDIFTLALPGGKTFTSRMPYLNGGLFDPDPEPLCSLDLPPELFANLFNFFSEYNFTIDENDPEDHEVGIDPEMLGHIFENLLEDNKDKGAYYTPKVIVSYMCRQSLLRYLETHLGKNEHLTRLCELHEPGDLREKDNWCATHARKIATLLENVKICDPAIGSGAFPIGMLNEIVRLRTLLNYELNDPAERAKLKKLVIQNSIYGVDLDSGAVDIARLRFWLALVVDEETPSPLPNLDYKIMQGNSLLESFQGVDLSSLHEAEPETTHETSFGLNQMEMAMFTNAQQEFREVQQKKQRDLLEAIRAYFAAGSPEEKTQLRKAIDQKVIAHIRHYFDATIEEAEIEHLQTETSWKDKRRHLAKWNPSAAETKRHEKRTGWIASLKKSLIHLDALQHQAERPFFLWHLLFQDVFENGGFDIVIANPPYVRHELITEQKPLLQAAGYTTYTGTADLLVYFYERAIQLLKPKGVLTFITSNKFYRADYGEKLRTHLTENLTLHTLIDFGEAPVFNGVAVDASILIAQKETASIEHDVSTLLWNQEKPATNLPVEIAKAFPVAQSSLTPDAWRLVSPAIGDLLAKLRSVGTPFGEYVDGRFYRGILTGFNEAFVIDGKKRAELIAADPRSEEIIKPFLMGDDVKRWRISPQDLWLIKLESSQNKTHSWSGTSDPWKEFCEAYPAIGEYFESLKHSYDKKGTSFWDRLHRREDQGTHFWELRSCSYWSGFEKPKLFYNETSKSLHSFYDRSGLYLNKTLFFLVSDDALFIQAVLMSRAFDFKYRSEFAAHGDAFQGGRPQFKKSAMERIPIPSATPEEKSRLSTLAEQCAIATAAGDTEALAAYEYEINQIVYRLFDLTSTEIDLIESSGIVPKPDNVAAVISDQHGHRTQKEKLYRILKILAEESSYFSIKRVRKVLEGKNLADDPDLLRRYLSDAMADGIVHDAGRGWYSSLGEQARLDPDLVRDLRMLLAQRFPLLPHYVWSTQQINPWMHHLLGKFVRFVYVESDAVEDMEEFLRQAGWDVTVNPTRKTASTVRPGDRSIVIRGVTREIDPAHEPRVENILIDLLLETPRLGLMDEVEFQAMTRNLITQSRVDIGFLLGRLSDHKKNWSDLVGNTKQLIMAES